MSTLRNGQLATDPLPGLLHALHGQQLSGLLTLDVAGGRVQVSLWQGYPIAVTAKADQLGQVLVESKLVLLDQVDRFSLSSDGRPFGQTLIEEGIITQSQLFEALRIQTRRRLHRLFFIERGSFSIEETEQEISAEEAKQLRIQPRRAIYHGIRGAWTAARCRQACQPFEGRALTVNASPEMLGRYGFSEADLTIVKAFSGATLARVTERTNQPHGVICALACVLHYSAALTVSVPLSAEESAVGDILRSRFQAARDNDLFVLLDVPDNATRDQIKSAYLAAAKAFHPDRYAGSPPERRAQVEQLFRLINEAYAILSDDKKRAAYIDKRNSPTPDAPDIPVDEERVRAIVDAEMAFLEGEAALRKHDVMGAVVAFKRAVDLNPEEAEHHALYAWMRVAAGQVPLSGIKGDLQKAIQLSPRCARAHHYLGVVLRDEGLLDEATTSLRTALEIDPLLTEAESELRLIAMRQGKKK